jgi:hypothetical protein
MPGHLDEARNFIDELPDGIGMTRKEFAEMVMNDERVAEVPPKPA